MDQKTMILCLMIVGLILVLMFFMGPDRGDE